MWDPSCFDTVEEKPFPHLGFGGRCRRLEGVVGQHLRGKRGGSVCSVNIYSDTCRMSPDWLCWMVRVGVCLFVWVGDRETVRQLSAGVTVRGHAPMNRFSQNTSLPSCSALWSTWKVAGSGKRSQELQRANKIHFSGIKQRVAVWFNGWQIRGGLWVFNKYVFALQMSDMQMWGKQAICISSLLATLSAGPFLVLCTFPSLQPSFQVVLSFPNLTLLTLLPFCMTSLWMTFFCFSETSDSALI